MAHNEESVDGPIVRILYFSDIITIWRYVYYSNLVYYHHRRWRRPPNDGSCGFPSHHEDSFQVASRCLYSGRHQAGSVLYLARICCEVIARYVCEQKHKCTLIMVLFVLQHECWIRLHNIHATQDSAYNIT